MAHLRIMVSLPEELAVQFVRAVPSNRRSRFVAGLIEAGLKAQRAERDAELIAACEAANADPETQEIEREMAALPDTMTEVWVATHEFSTAR